MTNTSEAITGQYKRLDPESTADSGKLIDCIAEALLEKKAKEIVMLDVRKLTTLTDYFIICHGTSETQIRDLANNVMDKTRDELGEKEWKQEGIDARRVLIMAYLLLNLTLSY